MTHKPYENVRVVELGSRIAAGACGRLLADLGATVYVIEPRVPQAPAVKHGKWVDRVSAVAGKKSILVDREDIDDINVVEQLLKNSDVVIRSSDLDEDTWPESWKQLISNCPIVCDITAFGSSGPLSGRFSDEVELQHLTGIVHTTGLPSGEPLPIGLPVLEMSGALYAACAISIALNVQARCGAGQQIEVALYDVAINALSTFLAAHYAGGRPGRLGNGHGMAVPWNAYPAAEGWILICTTNDAQWSRLAGLIGASAQRPEYAELKSRLAHRNEVDELVKAWTLANPLSELERQLSSTGIPCGRIVSVADIAGEPNIKFRGSVTECIDPVSGTAVRVPNAIFRYLGVAADPVTVPEPDSGRGELTTLRHSQPGWTHSPTSPPPTRALEGLRVIEIGQLTTAPLAARHLASLGADVIKIEPPGGESARAWEPRRNGMSHFFVLSNGEKRSVTLDLKDPADREYFRELVRTADVLLENLKPGALARMGFGYDTLQTLNPRLIYCAISGFGIHSAYPGRAAVDTVVQAMSGIMDSTRFDGTPIKAGISAADIAGGQTGLLLILASLAQRERTGAGCAIDISMQDVGAWMTQHRWNRAEPALPARHTVNTVADACSHAQTLARALIQTHQDGSGQSWEVIASPMRLSLTPPTIGTLISEPSQPPLNWRDITAHASLPSGSPLLSNVR